MENKKYLKISEFAKMANVSRQTIYNDLSSKLTDFVKIIDNVKYLDSEGLAVYGVKDLTPLDSQFTVKFDNDLTAFLQSQIEEKDKQIERLYSMLDQRERTEQRKGQNNSRKQRTYKRTRKTISGFVGAVATIKP